MKKKILGFIMPIMIIFSGCANEDNSSEKIETTDNHEVYSIISEIRRNERESHSGMLIFPLEEEKYQEAYLLDENYGLSTANQIYIVSDYLETDYRLEISRLLQLNYDNKHSYYTENEFLYPAIVTIYNDNSCYEYALLDNEQSRIVYVCSTFIDNLDFLKEEYRPVDYKSKNKSQNKYSIYWD